MKQNINIEAEGSELILRNKVGDYVIIPKKHRTDVLSMIDENQHERIDALVETLPVMEDYADDGSLIPDDRKKTTFEHNPYTAVQDNTYVAPRVVKHSGQKIEQQILQRRRYDEQQARYAASKIDYPSSDLRRKDVVPPNSMWMYPNLTGESQRAMTDFSNEAIGMALPVPGLEAMGKIPSVFKAGKNLIKPGVGKSVTSLIKKEVESTVELLNKSVQNAYKLNPWAFKPSSDNLYRGLGESGVKDAFESGVLRPRPAELRDIGEDIVTESGKTFRLKGKTFDKTYYSPKFKIADRYGDGYIAEVPKNSATFNNRYSTGKDWSMHTTEQIPIDKANILKKDWLMGYKKINAPKKQFKTDDVAKTLPKFESKIDWGKWSKEIPNNQSLMDEYLRIEKTAK